MWDFHFYFNVPMVSNGYCIYRFWLFKMAWGNKSHCVPDLKDRRWHSILSHQVHQLNMKLICRNTSFYFNNDTYLWYKRFLKITLSVCPTTPPTPHKKKKKKTPLSEDFIKLWPIIFLLKWKDCKKLFVELVGTWVFLVRLLVA